MDRTKTKVVVVVLGVTGDWILNAEEGSWVIGERIALEQGWVMREEAYADCGVVEVRPARLEHLVGPGKMTDKVK